MIELLLPSEGVNELRLDFKESSQLTHTGSCCLIKSQEWFSLTKPCDKKIKSKFIESLLV
jgi:hypothetical protein